MTARRVLVLAAVLWTLRWLTLELAAYAGHRWPRGGRDPDLPGRPPGRMPGPFDA